MTIFDFADKHIVFSFITVILLFSIAFKFLDGLNRSNKKEVDEQDEK